MRTSTDGWLVGAATVNGDSVPVSFHWDGQHWQRILASGFPTERTFTSVDALAADDAWAAASTRETGI